jgi:purine nucleoside phosphorylase
MKSSSLRTAVVALMEVTHPSVSDPTVLREYADALVEMATIAEGMGKMVTGGRYRTKAEVLRMRAMGL